MAKQKTKASGSPLANILAGNLDRATGEIEATIAALSNVSCPQSITARGLLTQALESIAQARGPAIETFESW